MKKLFWWMVMVFIAATDGWRTISYGLGNIEPLSGGFLGEWEPLAMLVFWAVIAPWSGLSLFKRGPDA